MNTPDFILIDYLDVISFRPTEESKILTKNAFEDLAKISKDRNIKVLVIDSLSPLRGLKEI